MTATIKAALSPFARAKIEFDSNPMHFLDEDLASVPVSGIPEEFRKLSRFLPVIVLVPKSAVSDNASHKEAGRKESGPCVTDSGNASSPLDAAKACFEIRAPQTRLSLGE